ncbi:MAG: lysine--tRNA ligase, partial [Vicingaceae bacterium]
MSRVLSEQEQLRRQSLEDLRKLGIDPYPADLFPVDSHAKNIKENYEEGREVTIAGRIMSRRIMGKAS